MFWIIYYIGSLLLSVFWFHKIYLHFTYKQSLEFRKADIFTAFLITALMFASIGIRGLMNL